jgi:glycosyltransferase involved in cell wall biosynthesis
MEKILVFVVAYQAEEFITNVLDRIAANISDRHLYEILVIDDASKDRTFESAQQYAGSHPELRITNLYNPINQGYGGNQQIGYQYAIENNFDVVILLHGDGQYPPELMNEMAEPILNGEFDVMLGSRMVVRNDALRGGMPLYKWIGNQILTWTENRLLKQNLSEYHTGFRAYRVNALQAIPFKNASKYYDFDTDIIIQITDNHFRIGEIPIPTKYGDEISRVNGMKYARMILKSCVESRIMRFGLFYNPKFDYTKKDVTEPDYQDKFGTHSSHQTAYDLIPTGTKVLDLGAGPGYMAKAFWEKGVKVTSVDKVMSEDLSLYSEKAIRADLNDYNFSGLSGSFDRILLLDVLEQLDSPEELLQRIRETFAPENPDIYISVGNVAFILTRMSLFFGKFNYGRLGILEMNKKRLFTQNSIKRFLKDNGYKITSVKGIPAPYLKAIPNHKRIAAFLQTVNNGLIYISKGLFAYQIFITAEPALTLPQLLNNAKKRK